MNEIGIIENINIKSMIYEVRGQLVMLDSDLAKLYECTNGIKSINLAVNRNIEKFPEDFYFRLTEEEYKNLRFQNETANMNRFLPYVFTEQGVSQLSSILKTPKANETSIKIMRFFVAMKNYLTNNSNFLEFKYMNSMLLDHDNRLNVLESFIPDIKTFTNQIFYEGQVYDSFSLILDIFNTSKESIIIIDNYISKELLDVLCNIKSNIIIYTKNISDTLLKKYNSQYKNVTIKIYNRFHDRFIIIDNKVLYYSGASFKDLGKKCFCINKIDDSDILNFLLNKLRFV